MDEIYNKDTEEKKKYLAYWLRIWADNLDSHIFDLDDTLRNMLMACENYGYVKTETKYYVRKEE